MTGPHDDRAQARAEAAQLLGVDVDRLSPADNLRVDMVSSLRLVIDAEQAAVLSGNQADLGKLNVAVASLIALLPNSKLPEPAPVDGGPSDPRKIMWETYKRMRERGAAFGEGLDGKVRRIAELEAKVAELEAALAVPGAANSAPASAGDNVVTLRRSCAGTGASAAPPQPPKPAPPAPDLIDIRQGFNDTPEPWRDYLNANYDRWGDNRT
jgi:hypothetical protein